MLAALDPEPRTPLRDVDGGALASRATLRRALSIAEALFSRGGAPPSARRLAWLAAELEDHLARTGPWSRLLLGASALVVSLAAPWFTGRLGPLGRLPLGARVSALAAFERRLGLPLLPLKAVLCILYYEHPAAAAEIGFPGARHPGSGGAP